MPRKKTYHPETPLGKWRQENGYTQQQAAELLGIKHNTIAELECGKRDIRPQTLKLLERLTTNVLWRAQKD